MGEGISVVLSPSASGDWLTGYNGPSLSPSPNPWVAQVGDASGGCPSPTLMAPPSVLGKLEANAQAPVFWKVLLLLCDAENVRGSPCSCGPGWSVWVHSGGRGGNLQAHTQARV